MNKEFGLGIDLGSTTAKISISSRNKNRYETLFFSYQRHHTKISEVLISSLKTAISKLGDISCKLSITGSAGMGVAEKTDFGFVQEVVASAKYLELTHPQVKTFIEIGGEDSKIIFFDENYHADMRMNGSCAGGTGSFLDQISVLLDIPIEQLNTLAQNAQKVFPIATRCGVFAKTDVQSLLSHNVSKEDIALSSFHAVVLQVLSTLTRGHDIEPNILLAGGPISFNTALQEAFISNIPEFKKENFIVPENSHLIPSIGASLVENENSTQLKLSEIIDKIETSNTKSVKSYKSFSSLPSLFNSTDDFTQWKARHQKSCVKRYNNNNRETKLFLGVDSGSTTTKVVLTDIDGGVVSTYYGKNAGDPINAVQIGLSKIYQECKEKNIDPHILGSAVTGYGEGLIKCAFNIDFGFVETLAHYRAASEFNPDVSFILDIGGQDMKAIYINNGLISDIQLNEACSSGSGSFIESFANNMNYQVSDFAEIACDSKHPYDLGTRCTVFMNTKVKQAVREGTPIEDISAGLSYSVIKNTLYKVLKLKDSSQLGSNIVVQGGTFKNNSVLRALELELGRDVIRPDIPELMGAYGCALKAIDQYNKRKFISSFIGLEESLNPIDISKTQIECKGCENRCQVTKLSFLTGNRFYIGNKCERIFTNNAEYVEPGENLVSEKRDIIFRRNLSARKPNGITIGIPRILNMFENFPFWATFLNECGFNVVLSDRSNMEIFEAGVKSVMSENICLPAKIAHGHILNLIEKRVDRIFFPNVVFEENEYPDSVNSFNCPVVTGYPCVIRSALDTEGKYDLPLDSPAISFKNTRLLIRQLIKFMNQFKIGEWKVKRAFKKAMHEQRATKKRLQNRARTLIKKSDETKKPLIVLAGRPYHIDKLINHGIPELISELGAIVIPEDSIPDLNKIQLFDVNVLSQWAYTNRLFATAKWISDHPHAQIVQLTSFGCGPDAVSVDEVKDILDENSKLHTVLKIDEVFNLGAVKIRLRSMLEAMRSKKTVPNQKIRSRKKLEKTSEFTKEKTILVPHFSKFFSSLTPALFEGLNINIKVLPLQNQESIEYGIKNINNEICYPAVLIAGDIIKAYQKYNYDVENTIVLMTQTGGQCRASNYINLIRKALDKIGFGDVHVATMSTKTLQTIVKGKEGTILAKKMLLGIFILDQLMYMYLSTKPREIKKGESDLLHQKYINRIKNELNIGDFQKALFTILKDAVDDFNSVKTHSDPVPRIGFVGEIFVKYNEYANMNLIEWILEQGAEVVLPPLQGFFLHSFISRDFNEEAHITDNFIGRITNKLIWNYVSGKVKKVDKIMQKYVRYKKPHDLYSLAYKTEKIISLANQFGEGWLLTADMLSMLEEGVENIMSVQPFGCISNHVIAKGIEKRVKNLYPKFKLLSLDFDQSTSAANIFNRAHFMIAAAKDAVKKSSAIGNV
jgi:predicted CoA-substrate-specific enzyme activase